MPLFSIIIPAYNSEGTITRCLESVLSQDMNDYELIVVDDGSTDLTGVIADELAQKNSSIKVIHNRNNLGVSVARNAGIDISIGDYLLFIDSDDYVGPGYLRSIYDAIIADKADIYIWGITKLVDGASPKKISPTVFSTFGRVDFLSSFLPLQLDCGLYGFVANKAVSRGLVEENGVRFDDSLRLLEDYDFYLSCYRHSERINVFALYDYYYVLPSVSLNSITRIGTVDYKSLIEVHQKCLDILKENGVYGEENKKLMDLTISNLVISAFLEMSPVSYESIELLFNKLSPWIPIAEVIGSGKTKLMTYLINSNQKVTLLSYLFLRELYHKYLGHI